MTELIRDQLDAGDDPALWEAVLGHVLAGLEREPGARAEVGRCSHWLRPHQSNWITHDGQWFAWPTGYGSGQGGMFVLARPQFDWSVVGTWDGQRWAPASGRSVRPAVRVTIPSRTVRHRQAAVHALWMNGRENVTWFYGFRAEGDAWACTAQTPLVKRKRRAS